MVKGLNQVNQLYVANAFAEKVDENSAVGTIGVKVINNGVGKELYFPYKGADTLMKSDYIQLKNLDYVKAIPAADMVTPLKSYLITLDEDVNGGYPISGQDYILRIELREFYGMSPEDVYFKEGAVHATAAMAAEPKKFYEMMVKSLNASFAREIGATRDNNPYLKFEATDEGILITEKPQDWVLGTRAQEPVYFKAVPTTVYTDGEDVIWGKVEEKTPAKKDVVVGETGIGNGKGIADLEYFLMGERGDQYRMIGWPNNIPTTYLVDPSKEYNALELHFAFTDTGVNSYRTEKDMTIVSADASVINSLIAAINEAAGLEIPALEGGASESEVGEENPNEDCPDEPANPNEEPSGEGEDTSGENPTEQTPTQNGDGSVDGNS